MMATAAQSKSYQILNVRPLMNQFAAEISGVPLDKPLSTETKRELHRALLEFEVIVLPPADLSPERHIELASAFGNVAEGAFFPRKNDYREIELITFDAERPPELNVWHSDVTWIREPPTGTVIQLVEGPPLGGNTVWSSGSKAFEALSEGYKNYLRGLTATHSWQGSSLVQDSLEKKGDDAIINAIKRFKPVVHPLVRRHPESGKEVIFVNEAFTRKINGIPFRESRAILEFLREWMIQPEFVYSHKWSLNGIAIWDNRSTQHYALADYWPNRRTVQRVTFRSDADFPNSKGAQS